MIRRIQEYIVVNSTLLCCHNPQISISRIVRKLRTILNKVLVFLQIKLQKLVAVFHYIEILRGVLLSVPYGKFNHYNRLFILFSPLQ